MKKDVVKRKRIGPGDALRELEERVASLETSVKGTGSLSSQIATHRQWHEDEKLEERVASLEKYRVDYMQVCERLARLERLVKAILDTNETDSPWDPESIPWGD